MSPSRRRRIACAAAAVAPFLLLTAFIALHRARAQSARMLDLEIRASGGTFAQLFWGAELAFVEERSMRIHLQPPGDGFQRLRFPLPPRTIRWIRLDPTDTAGEVLIRNMRLTDAGGQVLKTFHAADLRPASQIAWIRDRNHQRKVTEVNGRNSLAMAFTAEWQAHVKQGASARDELPAR